jgi:hypothetical protein
MLRWFHALMPKEERFFDLFDQHAQAIVGGAQALRELLNGGDNVPAQHALVMEREHDADNATREVLIAVRRTFITPFDRGNIRDLITSMDNSIDQMQKTSKSVMLFDIRTFTPHMQSMGDDIVECAGLVQEALPLLRSISNHVGRISRICEKISSIEGRADETHDIGLKDLYERHAKADAMGFITGNEVYDHLEKVVDRFDDVANELQGIVLDHV